VKPTDVTVIKEISGNFYTPSKFYSAAFHRAYKNLKPFVKQNMRRIEFLEIPLLDFWDENRIVTKKINNILCS